jgi:chromosome partitioning protein
MRKILVANAKGGCGKSTLVSNLAAYYAGAGKNTVVIDADRQESSLYWCQIRPNNVAPVLGLSGKPRSVLSKLPPDADRVLIDAPAGLTGGDLAALVADVDAIIVPVMPSLFDVRAAKAFYAELMEIAAGTKHKPRIGVVANRMKPWTTASQQSRDAMQELGFPVVAQLRDSSAYVMLTSLGKSIFDYASENVRGHQEDWKPLLKWLKD